VSLTFQAVSRIVGRYEILEPLGEGGMADVFLARQLDLDRLVALKELRILSGGDASLAQRFLREARMAGSLSHQNIVTVHDYFESEGTPFIAMEYMERGSLRPQIGHMPLAQVAGALNGVLAALDYAGRRGIVHRDIKPENVMIGTEGQVKIADFGISKARFASQTAASLTAVGTALGTPNYMAPEQASAEEVGPWTDIYATGVMAFEMFVGHPPFADTPQPLVLLMRQVRDPIPLVTDLDPRIDPRIANWIAWLTAKAPADRPQIASEAWERFEEIVVAILGPRWQRASPLLPGQTGAIHAAPVPLAVRSAGLAGAAADATAAPPRSATPPTGRLDDPRLAATVPANPDLLGISRTTAGFPGPATGAVATDTDKRGGRRRLAIVGATAAGALLAVLALGALTTHSAAPVDPTQRPAVRTTTGPPTPQPEQPVSEPAAARNTATDLSSQATGARRLARQYSTAADKIEALPATGAQAGQNALLADLTRKTSDAYARAGRAAARGDDQGYVTALSAALAAKAELQSATRKPAPAPADTSGSAAPQSSGCAGDSQSDDPSDDSCGGEP
jgi:protein kinase-like protein